MEKRQRSTNFSNDEKLTLVNIILKYKNIIENKKTDSVTIQDKNKAWQKVACEFNAASPNNCYRDSGVLKKFYENKKKEVRKIAALEKHEMRGTGGGPQLKIKKDSIYELILSLINEKTVYGMQNVFDSDVQNDIVGERSFEENYTYELANDSPTIETLITEKENMYMEVGDADIIVQPDETTPSVMIQASTSVKSTPQVSHKSIPDNKSKTIKRKRSATAVRALTSSNIAEKYNELLAARLRIGERMEREFEQKTAEHLKRMELLDLEIALKNKKLTEQ